MASALKLRRLPLESSQPVFSFAVMRLVLSVIAVGIVLATGIDEKWRVVAVIGAVSIPWSIFNIVLARRRPEWALSSFVGIGDLVVLAAVEAVVPETYGAVRFLAIAFVAAHAYFQGERLGGLVALAAIVLLVPVAAIRGAPVGGALLWFYEAVFVLATLTAAVAVGRLRTAESTSRVRARRLSRRVMEAEDAVRRDIAESIHDGPVQELVSLELMLTAADSAAARGDAEHAHEIIAEGRRLAERNVQALRDEIVNLGPSAFEELSFETAMEQCAVVWRRRFDCDVELDLENVDLPSDTAGALFRIAQEAVTNAGRHAEAKNVVVLLDAIDGDLKLRIQDDGKGFEGSNPLGASEPGHIGLASMRERAELIDGTIDIDTGDAGTTVTVRVPWKARP